MATTFTDFSTALNANPFGGTTSAMGVDRANLLTQFWNQFGPADNVAGFSNATDATPFNSPSGRSSTTPRPPGMA